MDTAEQQYRDNHTSDGRCKYPKFCEDNGVHVRPERLAGPRIAPDGRQFAWGPIDAIHTIGEYQIAEYREDQSNHSASQPWCWERHGRTLFHPWIAGRDMHASFLTLDSALVGAIAYKREGPNGRAARYFDLMTGASEEN